MNPNTFQIPETTCLFEVRMYVIFLLGNNDSDRMKVYINTKQNLHCDCFPKTINYVL